MTFLLGVHAHFITYLKKCVHVIKVLKIPKAFKKYLSQWSVVAERSSALGSKSRCCQNVPVRIPAPVSLSKTLNHNCFVLRMGRKAVGPVCCVMHVKEPRTLIVKRERGLPRCFWILALSTQQGGYVRATNLLYYYYYYY